MKFSELSANTDLMPLWPDDGDDGVYMRPMTGHAAKELRELGQSAARLRDRATTARDEAEDAELASEEAPDDDALRQRAFKARQAADDVDERADLGHKAFLDFLFTQVVVDGNGQPLEGDHDDISATLIARLWARIEEVHAEMGKSRRRKRTAKRGSSRGESSPTSSR